jgi:endonuclease YncB( thermonuclease family)
MARLPPFPRRIVLPPGALRRRRPLSRGQIAWLIVFFAATVLFALFEEHISGLPRAVDGDTIAIGDERIRLYAIDAPELGQPCRDGGDCGARARAYLSELIAGHTVECTRRSRNDSYGRVIAQCTVDGSDLGRQMVRSGHAMAYRAISSLYAADEPRTFDFESPSDYRERQPPQTERRRGHRS